MLCRLHLLQYRCIPSGMYFNWLHFIQVWQHQIVGAQRDFLMHAPRSLWTIFHEIGRYQMVKWVELIVLTSVFLLFKSTQLPIFLFPVKSFKNYYANGFCEFLWEFKCCSIHYLPYTRFKVLKSNTAYYIVVCWEYEEIPTFDYILVKTQLLLCDICYSPNCNWDWFDSDH